MNHLEIPEHIESISLIYEVPRTDEKDNIIISELKDQGASIVQINVDEFECTITAFFDTPILYTNYLEFKDTIETVYPFIQVCLNMNYSLS